MFFAKHFTTKLGRYLGNYPQSHTKRPKIIILHHTLADPAE